MTTQRRSKKLQEHGPHTHTYFLLVFFHETLQSFTPPWSQTRTRMSHGVTLWNEEKKILEIIFYWEPDLSADIEKLALFALEHQPFPVWFHLTIQLIANKILCGRCIMQNGVSKHNSALPNMNRNPHKHFFFLF